MILDKVEAGAQRAQGPARAVEERVGAMIVEPVSRTLDGADVAGRMESIAEGIGKAARPVGALVRHIERAVVRFVDNSVSPRLGTVLGAPPAAVPRERHAHAHEH